MKEINICFYTEEDAEKAEKALIDAVTECGISYEYISVTHRDVDLKKIPDSNIRIIS